MPQGPQGQRRPADTVSSAVMVGRIATGEIKEDIVRSPYMIDRGRKGGEARARSLNPARRNQIAKRAAASRWN